MSEVLIPPWIVPEDESQEPLDEGSSVFGAAFAPGIAQRQSYGGMRLKLSRRHTVRLEEKAQLLSVLRSTRGRYHALRSKVHFALRGSFPAAELLTNGTFENGTTGWTAFAPATAIDVTDRRASVRRIASNATTSTAMHNTNGVSLSQFSSYVVRAMTIQGRNSNGTYVTAGTAAGSSASGGLAGSATSYGLLTAGFVAQSVADYYASVGDFAITDTQAGDYIDVPFISLSRCALVANPQNLWDQSNAIDHANWTKNNSTVTANAFTSPNGGATGDRVVETTANSSHGVDRTFTKGATAEDFCFAVALRTGDGATLRDYIAVRLDDGSSSNYVEGFFRLTTVEKISESSIGTFSNVRAFIMALGSGWSYCCVIGRTSTGTSVRGRVLISQNSAPTLTYAGDIAANIGINWPTLVRSSLPVNLVATTSVAVASTAQTGSALYVKGLPASTNGLLLPEDIFEINGELKTCTSTLRSDATGLGYLQFEPALVRSPADNDPVIILNPMGKFLMSNLKIDNEFGTQAIVSYDLEHIYE